MTYRISTNRLDDTLHWWRDNELIPSNHGFIREASDFESAVIDEILKDYDAGNVPSEKMGHDITSFLSNAWKYVLFTGGGNIFLTGPFQTHTEAEDYGAIAEKRCWNNDANWRVIALHDTLGLQVKTPVAFDIMPAKYIVVTSDTDVYLVGPFADSYTRRDYGATAQQELWGDDPHWSTIDLRYPSETGNLRIEVPADIVVVPGAYNLACGRNPEPLLLLKKNDLNTSPHLIADGIVAIDQHVNLFDLSLVDYRVCSFTDIIAEDGFVESLLIEVTRTPVDGPTVVELFLQNTPPLDYKFIRPSNSVEVGARVSLFIFSTHLYAGTLMSNGVTSSIFTETNDFCVYLYIDFHAKLNLKTSYADGKCVAFKAVQTSLEISPIMKELTFKVIGWTPRLWYAPSIENKITGHSGYKGADLILHDDDEETIATTLNTVMKRFTDVK